MVLWEDGQAPQERGKDMMENMAQMLATGFVWGAFLVGAAGGITVTFLFLCWLGDAYEDWRKSRNRKRREREMEVLRRAYEASHAEAEAPTRTTAS